MSVGMPEGSENESGPNANDGNESGPNAGPGASNTDRSKDDEIAHLRDELRKFRRQEGKYKDSIDKAVKFDELQREKMTDAERSASELKAASDRAAALEARASAAESELERFMVAAEHGITAGDMKFLKGLSGDELKETAKELAERLKAAEVPNFDLGARSSSLPTNADMGDFLRNEINRARGRGRR